MKNNPIGRLFFYGGVVFLGTALFLFPKEVREVFFKEVKLYSDISETTESHLKAGRWENALNDLLRLVDQQSENQDIKFGLQPGIHSKILKLTGNNTAQAIPCINWTL